MADDQWVLLVDPAWQPGGDTEAPPRRAVTGGWLAHADGSIGRFEPNPDYEPSGPDSPTDALDAAVRAGAGFDRIAAVFRSTTFSVAVDGAGQPMVAPSPDGVPCVLVVSAVAHRQRVRAAGWLTVEAPALAAMLDGTDVLLNPGAPSCMRLPAETVHETVS
jgi:hypothetical protein